MIEIPPRRNYALIGSYFLLLIVVTSSKECDKRQCPGPLRLYEDLDCIPIREKPEDCCAVRYDCSHVYNRSLDKCYANGHEYSVGESLRDEDRINPCDQSCICRKRKDEPATFRCPYIDCQQPEPKAHCYTKRKLDTCCGVEQVCRELVNEPQCIVDGKTYWTTQIFYPSSNFSLICQCDRGYKGENVPPFCQRASCGVEAQNQEKYRNLECAPLYMSHKNPAIDCYSDTIFHCPKDEDKVLRSSDQKNEKESDLNVCKFGNLTLNVGDKLDDSFFRVGCRECICEVPPTLTCKLLGELIMENTRC